jgi:hypothetical protein
MSTAKSTIPLLPFNEQLVKLFPDMTEQEFNDLVADIDKNGQRVEIDTWNGQIIEGRHRALACQKLGRKPRYRERRFADEIGARDYVVSQNFARRHLTPEHKRILVARFADWSKSDRAIAEQLKTNKNTVARIRKAAEQKKASTVPTGTVEKKRTGKDGKVRKQPAKKVAKVEPRAQAEAAAEKIRATILAEAAAAKVEPTAAEPKPIDRRQALLDRAREAISLAQFDDLHGLPVDEEMCKLVQATATAWLEVVRIVTSRKPAPVAEASCGANPFVRAAPAGTDDYPDLPACINRALRQEVSA